MPVQVLGKALVAGQPGRGAAHDRMAFAETQMVKRGFTEKSAGDPKGYYHGQAEKTLLREEPAKQEDGFSLNESADKYR